MMIKLARTLRQIGIALASGYILMFFSEFLFYRQLSEPGTPVPSALDVLTMWLVYSVMAYLALVTTRYFRARNLAALFLVGAVYGWLLGCIVDAHRGRIWVESPGYDENACPGSTFFVQLPVALIAD